MTRLLLILPILFEAISEGLYLHGDKVISKQIQVLLIASWFLIVFMFAWEAICIGIKSKLKLLKLLGKYILLYVLFRVVLFNYVHNLAAHLPLDYIGTVSIIDRIVAVASFGQWWMIGLFQIICVVCAYYIMKGKL
jgi:hypothetical protein